MDAVSIDAQSVQHLPEGEPLLTVEETARRLGEVTSHVTDLIKSHKLIAVRVSGAGTAGVRIPEAFLGEKGVNRFVPGAIALLHDGGFADAEILRYLFTEDETLPGRPIDVLHGPHAREVLRRAQAMGF